MGAFFNFMLKNGSNGSIEKFMCEILPNGFNTTNEKSDKVIMRNNAGVNNKRNINRTSMIEPNNNKKPKTNNNRNYKSYFYLSLDILIHKNNFFRI